MDANPATPPRGGVAADHPQPLSCERFVAPATPGELNTFRPGLFPIACWRLDDIRFDFDSSFIRPEAAREMRALANLLAKHPGAPLSIFGHADPVGSEEYNNHISGRRAQAVYSLLTRDLEIWTSLYHVPYKGDSWGTRSVQIMLEALGYSPGPIDGIEGDSTSRAIAAFQAANGCAADGVLGPQTRPALFAAYMDFLCGAQFRLNPANFLARGAGSHGKGDYQGCSAFNPIVRFSAEQEHEYARPGNHDERNRANAPNRRVVAFLFRPGSRVDPERWPCPHVAGGTGRCHARFWSDWHTRYQPSDSERHYEDTSDTFACRFYDRMARRSPCESLRPVPLKTWIRIIVLDAQTAAPVPLVQLTVRSSSGQEFVCVTDDSGAVLVENLDEGPVQVVSGESAEADHLAFVGFGPRPSEADAFPCRAMPVPSSNPPVIRQIARIRIDPAPADSSPFVNVEAPSDDDGELAGEHVEPFRKEGLETEKIHEIRVAPLEKFEIRLRDEHDFPIPEADYQVTFSDLTVENGKLDLRGAAILWNPPPGPLEIIYPDLDDVKAKSLAGRVRKACATADLNELHKVLLYSPSLIELAAAAYKRYFDNLSGKGMAEDIQKSITNDMQLQAIQCLMALAGLPTWIPYRFKTAPVSEEVFA